MRFAYLFLFIWFNSLFVQAQNTKVWSLQACIAYAKEHNISIQKSTLNAGLQAVEVAQSKARFYPDVTANAGGNFYFGKPGVSDSFGNTYGVQTAVNLYNGGRTKIALQQAENNLKISKLQTEEIKDNISLQIINTYMNVLFSKENLAIAEEQLRVGKKMYQRMHEFVESGVKAAKDLYQVKANLARDEEEVVKARNRVSLALLDLSQLLQIPYSGFDVPDVPVAISDAELLYKNANDVYTKALQIRPEIERANKSIENATLGIAVAKAGKKPVVTASYGFNTFYNYYWGEGLNPVQQNSNDTSFFEQLKKERGHHLGLSLRIPLFDRFETKNNVQRAKIRRQIAAYNLENEKTLLEAKIERAYIDAETSLKTFEAAQKTLEAQQEAFRTAQERYNLGILTSYDFDQVREKLVQAQSAFVRAKYNYVFRTKLLDFYAGLPVDL